MDNTALSENEFNSLIDSSPDSGFEIGSSEPVTDEPKRFALGQQTKRAAKQLPGLEQLNEGFGISLKSALQSLLGLALEIKVDRLKHESLSDLLGKIPSPLSAFAVDLRPLPGSGLLTIEPQLIYAIVDMLFGGKGHQANPAGYTFSQTENSIATRLIDIVSQQYRLAWMPIAPLSLAVQATFDQAKFVDIAEPSEMFVVTRVCVNLGEVSGNISLSFPYASLSAVLAPLVSASKVEGASVSDDWFVKMSGQLSEAKLELVVHLTEIETTVQGLLNLRIGQTLDCNIHPCLTADVEGVPFLTGHYGLHQGRYALRVQKILIRQGFGSDSHSY